LEFIKNSSRVICVKKIALTAILANNGIRSECDAIPGASRLRNQNEILIEKSDEAKVTQIPVANLF